MNLQQPETTMQQKYFWKNIKNVTWAIESVDH
jgi:hypothetical protein